MFSINDLILNIGDSYKEFDDRLIKLYKQEFEMYSDAKLEKVWETIQENHGYAKAPELGNIFKYMNLVGISRTRQTGDFYKECTTCKCHYSIKSRVCPKCNKHLEEDDVFANDVLIIKSKSLPDDFILCQENCSVCPPYKANKPMRGSTCNAWGSLDPYKKIGKGCDKCACRSCCEEVGKNNPSHSIGEIMNYVKNNLAPDPYWILFYEKLDVKNGMISNYAGNKYKNKTGNYLGHSPKIDTINWEHTV